MCRLDLLYKHVCRQFLDLICCTSLCLPVSLFLCLSVYRVLSSSLSESLSLSLSLSCELCLQLLDDDYIIHERVDIVRLHVFDMNHLLQHDSFLCAT